MYTMRPQAFEYHRPETLDRALELLADVEDSRPLAGGHSLLPMMKLRLAAPAALVDLGRLPGLDEIAQDGDAVTIGALTTHAAIAASDLVSEACPVLAETAAIVGDRQVRNRGTIGGSLAHADPSADYPTLMKALGATITATGKDGERRIAADDFFVDLFTTALRPGELVTSVTVPATRGIGAVYLKHRHPASSYAVVGVAAVVGVNGSFSSARLVVGGATSRPVAVDAVTEMLVGRSPEPGAITAAADAVRGALESPTGDTYASGEYRVHLATVMAKRALTAAVERARG
jgi:aerobic carbon-monoxide dehydrogenase medium subunit